MSPELLRRTCYIPVEEPEAAEDTTAIPPVADCKRKVGGTRRVGLGLVAGEVDESVSIRDDANHNRCRVV